MLKDYRCMKLGWALLMLLWGLLGVACTARNPEKCLNGTCSDEGFPYCDSDGSVGGTPGACIAVSCTPDAFETCSGDNEIRCNEVGTNFDVVECAHGCAPEASGCRECTEDAHCSGTKPVCEEATGTCRECAKDDECPSRVCDVDEGSCVAEPSVLYASPIGNGTLCSQARPCSLADVLVAAQATNPIIRLLPGVYTTPVDIAFAPQPVKIIGTDATLTLGDTTPAFAVRNGANVETRGISIVSKRVLRCGAETGPVSSAKFRDAKLIVLGNESTVLGVTRCSALLSNTEISLGDSEIAIELLDSATVTIDRSHIHGNTSHHILTSGSNVQLTLTSSLLVDVGIDINNTDTVAPGSRFTFAYATLVYTMPFNLGQGCASTSPHLSTRYENSILAPLGAFDALNGPNTRCTFTNTFLGRQAVPPAGTVVADPQFVAPTTRDFHLKASSPAVDAATPSLYGLDSQLDLDGRPRPVGSKADVGAYEHAQ